MARQRVLKMWVDGWHAAKTVSVRFAAPVGRLLRCTNVEVLGDAPTLLTVRLMRHRWSCCDSFVCYFSDPTLPTPPTRGQLLRGARPSPTRWVAAPQEVTCALGASPPALSPPSPAPTALEMSQHTVLDARPEAGTCVDAPNPPGSAVYRLACPASDTHNLSITRVLLASFGTPGGECITGGTPTDSANKSGGGGVTGLVRGRCHHPRSVATVQEWCLGKRSCTILADASRFGGGDPCPGVSKRFVAAVACGDDKDRSKALRSVIYRTRHPLAAALGGGGSGGLAELLSFNLTFTEIAVHLENEAPGLVALVAALASLVALVLLVVFAVVCVRLRRLSAEYARLVQLTSAPPPVDDDAVVEMKAEAATVPAPFY